MTRHDRIDWWRCSKPARAEIGDHLPATPAQRRKLRSIGLEIPEGLRRRQAEKWIKQLPDYAYFIAEGAPAYETEHVFMSNRRPPREQFTSRTRPATDAQLRILVENGIIPPPDLFPKREVQQIWTGVMRQRGTMKERLKELKEALAAHGPIDKALTYSEARLWIHATRHPDLQSDRDAASVRVRLAGGLLYATWYRKAFEQYGPKDIKLPKNSIQVDVSRLSAHPRHHRAKNGRTISQGAGRSHLDIGTGHTLFASTPHAERNLLTKFCYDLCPLEPEYKKTTSKLVALLALRDFWHNTVLEVLRNDPDFLDTRRDEKPPEDSTVYSSRTTPVLELVLPSQRQGLRKTQTEYFSLKNEAGLADLLWKAWKHAYTEEIGGHAIRRTMEKLFIDDLNDRP